MKIKTLDNDELYWSLDKTKYVQSHNQSNLHIRCRVILNILFPTLLVLEEVPINITRHNLQYLDFYLPLIKLAIEVQGQQHYKFNSHFYKSKHEFIEAQKRDQNKVEWCELNQIRLIHLKYDEDDSTWKNKILIQ